MVRFANLYEERYESYAEYEQAYFRALSQKTSKIIAG